MLVGCCTDGPASYSINATNAGILTGVAGGALMSSNLPLGIAVGGLGGGLIASQLLKQKTLLEQLIAQGVRISVIGEQVSFIVPARALFAQDSNHMLNQGYTTLDLIARALRHYPKTAIQVAGHTNNQGSEQRNVALSRAQAKAVADYLWEKDVDTRFIYAVGKGSSDPIANNLYPLGRQQNQRVEITFQYLTSSE